MPFRLIKEMHLKMLSAKCQPSCSGHTVLSHCGLVMLHGVRNPGQYWFRQWHGTCLVPSHCLNGCWVTVNWTLRNKLQRNFHFYKMHSNAVCKMTAISFKPLCVKSWVRISGFTNTSYFCHQFIIYSSVNINITPTHWLFYGACHPGGDYWNYYPGALSLKSSHSSSLWTSGPLFNVKMSSHQYRKSHCGDSSSPQWNFLYW